MHKLSSLNLACVFFLCCFLASNVLKAQTASDLHKKKVFKITVNTDEGAVNGYLFNITDSTVEVSPNFIAFHDTILSIDRPLRTINYSVVKSLTIRRKGTVRSGALVGAAGGALIGLLTYKKSTGGFNIDLGPAPNAVLGGLIGAGVGALIGELIREQTITIDRDKTKLREFKLDILRRAHERND
jgi:hypothetical protein